MKRNIFIRMLCLLLCVSMITPTVAAATSTIPTLPPFIGPQYQNNWNPTWGETTNAMEYVDQFFNHDGTFSKTGEALLHWLDMTPKGEQDALRQDSGYLTLEVEIDKRSDWKYGINKAVNVVTGFPSAVAGLFSESEYEKMFPDSGKKAMIYYDTLQQIYLEYKQEALAEIVKSEVYMNEVLDGIGEINEYGAAWACADCIKTASLIAVNPEISAKGKYTVRSTVGVKYDIDIVNGIEQKKNVRFVVQTVSGPKEIGFKEITKSCRDDGVGLIMDYSQMEPEQWDEFCELWNSETERFFEGMKRAGKDPGAMTVGYLKDFANGVEKAPGFSKLSQAEQETYKKANTVLTKPEQERQNKIKEWSADVEEFLDVAGIVWDMVSYYNDYDSMTTLQARYMDALLNVTDEYRKMLSRWSNSIKRDNIISTAQAFKYFDQMYGLAVGDTKTTFDESDNKAAMLDALDAMRRKIAAGFVETAINIEKMNKAEGAVLSSQERNEVFLGIIETIFGWATGISLGLVDIVKKAAGANEILTGVATMTGIKGTLAKLGVGAIKVLGSPITLIVTCCYASAKTGKRLEFADSATAVSNLKWSLCGNIIDLLAQYGQHGRNHETACSIIEALKTMAAAKYYGENLVREYYLDDLYDELGINPGSSLHTVLWNELQTNSARLLPDIKEVTEAVIVVYEEDVRIVVDGDDEKITRVLGVFSKDASSQATFNGQPLSTINTEPRFNNLQGKDPDTYAGMDFNTWSEGWQPNGQNAKNRYKSHRAYLYSRNGLDLIITDEEYQKYLEIREALADLSERNDRNDTKLSKSERLNADRLSWTWECQQWIDSLEMYNASVDYSTHKIKHGIVPN